MIYATERELQLTRELLQARIVGAQQVAQSAQLQAELLKRDLAALPGKWEVPKVDAKKARA